MTSTERFQSLHTKLSKERPQPLLALGKSLLVGFNFFAWLGGMVMVVWPLAKATWSGFMINVVDKINGWLWAEPQTGGMIVLLINATMLAVTIWLARNYIMLMALWVLSRFTAVKIPTSLRPNVARTGPGG